MDISVTAEMQHNISPPAVGPYLKVTVTLDEGEVPAADAGNKFAEWVVDKIVHLNPIAGMVKDALTGLFGKLTPDIKKNDRGYGVVVVTHVPAGGVGVPYSTVSPRPAPSPIRTVEVPDDDPLHRGHRGPGIVARN